uniref:Uncharacterized protein n=1 Tax=Anguilla anguilla TaxID=7936 RepID=A0A0E9XQR4_ANGAN
MTLAGKSGINRIQQTPHFAISQDANKSFVG